ncbi:hypothetical protein JL722_3854 [Aureococcus anophagefferens]|nr:hypothetical protein JL722_3854 [Aureococcus anophagefferens]
MIRTEVGYDSKTCRGGLCTRDATRTCVDESPGWVFTFPSGGNSTCFGLCYSSVNRNMFHNRTAKCRSNCYEACLPFPTILPSPVPSQTFEPTGAPTANPSDAPTVSPYPTEAPTDAPKPLPTIVPYPAPTRMPYPRPTRVPRPLPTYAPTQIPTAEPTPAPSYVPTPQPAAADARAVGDLRADGDADDGRAQRVADDQPPADVVPDLRADVGAVRGPDGDARASAAHARAHGAPDRGPSADPTRARAQPGRADELEIWSPAAGSVTSGRDVDLGFQLTLPEETPSDACELCVSVGDEVLTCQGLEVMLTEQLALQDLLPGTRELRLALRCGGGAAPVEASATAVFVVGADAATGAVDVDITAARAGGDPWRAAVPGAANASGGRAAYFSAVYDTNGPGSTAAAAANARAAVEALVSELGVAVVLDAPCGDMTWMAAADLGAARYVGADIVADVVARNAAGHASPARRFLELDVADAASADELARGGGDFVLASGHKTSLLKPPYCARDPARRDAPDTPDQYLGLWDLAKGPVAAGCGDVDADDGSNATASTGGDVARRRRALVQARARDERRRAPRAGAAARARRDERVREARPSRRDDDASPASGRPTAGASGRARRARGGGRAPSGDQGCSCSSRRAGAFVMSAKTIVCSDAALRN